MAHTFTRYTFTSFSEVAGASLEEMLMAMELLWEEHQVDARPALGDAAIHHHLLLQVADAGWPQIDAGSPAYWCVVETNDMDYAKAAFAWCVQQGEDGYGFISYGNGPYRVVFVTMSETDSVMFKTGFG